MREKEIKRERKRERRKNIKREREKQREKQMERERRRGFSEKWVEGSCYRKLP